jgi:hypothetical protein
MPVNNTVFSFSSYPGSKTKVTTATTHGLSNSASVEIMLSNEYAGTWIISNVDNYSFVINTPFTTNEQNCRWQITRNRPVHVNVTGENIDTLRQAVNQIGSDVGNRLELDPTITNKNNLVEAINTLKNEDAVLNLILSIALN